MAAYELLDVARSVVVVIDLQGKLMDMIHRPRLVIDATKRLMQLAEIFEVPVILTEQYPQGLGVTHPEVREAFDALGAIALPVTSQDLLDAVFARFCIGK